MYDNYDTQYDRALIEGCKERSCVVLVKVNYFVINEPVIEMHAYGQHDRPS